MENILLGKKVMKKAVKHTFKAKLVTKEPVIDWRLFAVKALKLGE